MDKNTYKKVVLKMLILILIVSCNGINSKIERIYELDRNKNFEKVIELSTEIINVDNNNREARLYRGKAYQKIRAHDAAFIDFIYLYSILRDSSSEVLDGLGFAYLQNGEYAKSFTFYEKLILIDKQNPSYYFNNAANLYYSSQFKDAIVYINKALLLDSLNVDYLKFKALTFIELLKYNEAINCYNLLILNGQISEKIYFDRGMIYFLKENYDSAILDFNKSIEINSKIADFYYYRGLANSKLGNRILACKDLEHSKVLNKLDFDQTYLDYCNQ